MKFKMCGALHFSIYIEPKFIIHFNYLHQILYVKTKFNVVICSLIEQLFTKFKTPLNHEVRLLVNISKEHDKQY